MSDYTAEPADDELAEPPAGRVFDDHDEDDDDPGVGRTSTAALFEGDDGGLELAQRRVLVVLIKQRFISAQTHPKDWRALIANPRPIRARLNDMFMGLHLDREREVAYKYQVAPEGNGAPFPTLLYDTPWGREETILLVYLRGRYRSEQASGADHVYVDLTDMLDHIAQYRPEHATDVSGDARKAVKAVEAMHKAGLLIGARADERFEVSRAIEVLLPVEKLQELLTWLREQNGERAASDEPGPAADNVAEGDGPGAVIHSFPAPQVAPSPGTESES
jgi:hypothetical protein